MFVRNFLSFWIATVLIAVLTIAATLMAYNHWSGEAVSLPLPALQACAANLLRNGVVNRTAEPNACGILYVADRSRAPASPAVPENIRSLAEEVSAEVPLKMRLIIPGREMVAFRVPGYTGDVRAVAMLKSPHPPPLFLGWQIVVACIVSTITCLLLTRHIVNPIRELQSSTDAFGHGRLDSRPPEQLLKRSDELGELSNTIARMSDRISILMASQREFLVQVSHELGSPLTRLRIALELARRKADPGLLPALDRIQCESSELNSMIQQLLKLARLNSGLEEEEQETYSIELVMEEVCADAQYTAVEMGKHVKLVSAPPLSVHGHRELLKRALDNVLRNAIRFTPQNGFVLVEVREESTACCVIEVKDSGVGVPEDKLEAIFEPFVRAVSNADRAGAGVGLAIAKQGVLANGGNIRALNSRQGGLLIQIRLPLVPATVADGVATHSAADKPQVSE